MHRNCSLQYACVHVCLNLEQSAASLQMAPVEKEV